MAGARQTLRGTLRRLRQPEYTGENRCFNCTVLNTVIAVACSGVVALVSIPVAGLTLLACIATIGLRGYLVPGTPTLVTYLPGNVHERIGPGHATDATRATDADDSLDIEAVLTAAGIVRVCDETDDLCLTESYREAFREQIAQLQASQYQRERLAASLSVHADEVRFETDGGRFDVYVDGVRAGGWRSKAAFLADLGNEHLLASWLDNWDGLPPERRTRLLVAMRTFVETCPDCGGAVDPDEEVVRTCCREDIVSVTMRCRDCEAVVFSGTD